MTHSAHIRAWERDDRTTISNADVVGIEKIMEFGPATQGHVFPGGTAFTTHEFLDHAFETIQNHTVDGILAVVCENIQLHNSSEQCLAALTHLLGNAGFLRTEPTCLAPGILRAMMLMLGGSHIRSGILNLVSMMVFPFCGFVMGYSPSMNYNIVSPKIKHILH